MSKPLVTAEEWGACYTIHEKLAQLRTLREQWYNGRSREAAQQRELIYAKIRQVVDAGRATHRYEDMADELGISRQQLDNIMRGDPTGKR